MENAIKVLIDCFDKKLGEAAYSSISSMPVENSLQSLIVDPDYRPESKTLEEHFKDATDRLKEVITANTECDFFCHVSDRVVNILDQKYLVTIAVSTLKSESMTIGTGGLLAIDISSYEKLLAGKISTETLYDLPLDLRVREATNNARVAAL